MDDVATPRLQSSSGIREIAASPEAPRNVHTFSRRVTAFLLATSAYLTAFSPRRVEKEEKESRLAASVTCQVPQAYRMLS